MRPIGYAWSMSTKSMKNHTAPIEPRLHVGFVLLPRFTLTAFAGFVDVLRLAADEGDRSRMLWCRWSVLGEQGNPIAASCGTEVLPTAEWDNPQAYDYIVLVGGLLQGDQQLPASARRFLHEAAAAKVTLVGLCTGSFALARAGLLNGYLSCVSWFHRDEFVREFPAHRVVSEQMFVIDRDRLTSAGGTSVVYLAAYLIERHISRANAVKALRILIEQQPLPAHTLQPEQALPRHSIDSLVHRAMLLLEQSLHQPMSTESLCRQLAIGRRQLERRFIHDIALSPQQYQKRLRLERARWLLGNSDLQMIEISQQCGFEDSSSFSRAIRKYYRQSPRELRVFLQKRPASTVVKPMPPSHA